MEFDFLYRALIAILMFLPILAFHEAAHAWMAWKLGDETALRQGRLTLNPISHIDPIGTIAMPVISMLAVSSVGFGLIGWGRPVPFDPRAFANVRRDEILVAMAGPVSNLILAFVVMVVASWLPYEWETRWYLWSFAFLSVFLAVFNMIPIPPLDGHYLLRHIFKVDERFLYGTPILWLVLLLVLINQGWFRSILYAASSYLMLGLNGAADWLSGAQFFGMLLY